MYLRELRLQRARCGGEQFRGSYRAPYGLDVDKQRRGCGLFVLVRWRTELEALEKNTAPKHRHVAFVVVSRAHVSSK